mmetsp:Transcript_13309/g.20802  ORF Transcript_13309/g.20802 Transcript_13309/m.20802 type:complete len:152 (+) Transcript_13309:289-744(+)
MADLEQPSKDEVVVPKTEEPAPPKKSVDGVQGLESSMSFLDIVSQIQRELNEGGGVNQFGYKVGSAVGLGSLNKEVRGPTTQVAPLKVTGEAQQPATAQPNSLLQGQQETKDFFNRQEAFTRYGIDNQPTKKEEQKPEKKAALGGVIFAKG